MSSHGMMFNIRATIDLKNGLLYNTVNVVTCRQASRFDAMYCGLVQHIQASAPVTTMDRNTTVLSVKSIPLNSAQQVNDI
jgi:hypothetical protein